MEQIPGTTPGPPAAEAQQDGHPAATAPQDGHPQAEAPQGGPAAPEPPAQADGFRARGRMRRRARFLRGARELAYRDLGGLVFNLHRFGRRNDELVLTKLSMLERIDEELRALETALREREPVTVLREAGIIACPRCAAIHAGEDRYCPNCGLSTGRHADLPIAAAAPGTAVQPAVLQPSAPAPSPAQPAGVPPSPPGPAVPVRQERPAPQPPAVPSPAAAAPTTAVRPPAAQVGRSPVPPVGARTQSAQSPGGEGGEPGADTPGEQTEIIRPPAGTQ